MTISCRVSQSLNSSRKKHPHKRRNSSRDFIRSFRGSVTVFNSRRWATLCKYILSSHQILPMLLDELKDVSIVPFLLPNIFRAATNMPQVEFTETVLPKLRPVFVLSEPVQTPLLLLQNLQLLIDKCDAAVIKSDLLPMVFRAMESTNMAVLERAFSVVTLLAPNLDYTLVKTAIFPRVQRALSIQSSLPVRYLRNANWVV